MPPPSPLQQKIAFEQVCFGVFVCIALVFFSPSYPKAENLDALLSKVDRVRAPGLNFAFDVHVVAPGGAELALKVRVRERTKSLVRYVDPPKSRGRSLLFVEENMWVYVPGTRRPLRISPNQQILGGVSSADVARTVFDIDFKPVSVSPTVPDSRMKPWVEGDLRILRLEARHKKTAYARIDLTVGENARPYRATFYSLSGRKLKTAYFHDYRQMLGESRPGTLTIIDHLNGDSETRLEYSNMTLDETPSSWFRPNYLLRLR